MVESNLLCMNCDKKVHVPGNIIYQKQDLHLNGCTAVYLHLMGFIDHPESHCRCYREHPELHPFESFKGIKVKTLSPSLTVVDGMFTGSAVIQRDVVDE